MTAVKLKICGVMSRDMAVDLAEMGVDFIGLNFVPASKRCISLEDAREICEAIRGTDSHIVLLFQDQPLEMVLSHTNMLKPDYVQLHGNEDLNYLAEIDAPVIKSFTPGQNPDDLPKNAVYYLLDRPGRGQGRATNVRDSLNAAQFFPDNLFLAGGLDAGNLPELLASVRPFALDIASGVRTNGKIDPVKVRKILEIIRR